MHQLTDAVEFLDQISPYGQNLEVFQSFEPGNLLDVVG